VGEKALSLRAAVVGAAGHPGGSAPVGALAVFFEFAVEPVHLLGAEVGERDTAQSRDRGIWAAVR
jgi:hypothetical protein